MTTREELEQAVEDARAALIAYDKEAMETHLRLRNFAEDWDAPGMEVYDKENT